MHCTYAERRYHSYELEVLAVVETFQRLRIYVIGKPFRLITDCAAITRTRTQTELILRIARWWMKLLEYNFEPIHRAGSRLAHVDALSRAPVEPPSEIQPAGFVLIITSDKPDWLLTMQLQDPSLLDIMKVLRGDVVNEQSNHIKNEYTNKGNRLYRKTSVGLRLVVPKNVRWRIVQQCHILAPIKR